MIEERRVNKGLFQFMYGAERNARARKMKTQRDLWMTNLALRRLWLGGQHSELGLVD